MGERGGLGTLLCESVYDQIKLDVFLWTKAGVLQPQARSGPYELPESPWVWKFGGRRVVVVLIVTPLLPNIETHEKMENLIA